MKLGLLDNWIIGLLEAAHAQAEVAQISNLLYRRASSLRELRMIQRTGSFAGLPIANRRYSRFKICVTLAGQPVFDFLTFGGAEVEVIEGAYVASARLPLPCRPSR